MNNFNRADYNDYEWKQIQACITEASTFWKRNYRKQVFSNQVTRTIKISHCCGSAYGFTENLPIGIDWEIGDKPQAGKLCEDDRVVFDKFQLSDGRWLSFQYYVDDGKHNYAPSEWRNNRLLNEGVTVDIPHMTLAYLAYNETKRQSRIIYKDDNYQNYKHISFETDSGKALDYFKEDIKGKEFVIIEKPFQEAPIINDITYNNWVEKLGLSDSVKCIYEGPRFHNRNYPDIDGVRGTNYLQLKIYKAD